MHSFGFFTTFSTSVSLLAIELLVYTVVFAEFMWINVDLDLFADLRPLQSAAHNKKTWLECQLDLPMVRYRNMEGIWKAQDLADWIWMSRQATLNLSQYPCSFRVCCCLAAPIIDYPQGKKWKMDPCLPAAFLLPQPSPLYIFHDLNLQINCDFIYGLLRESDGVNNCR